MRGRYASIISNESSKRIDRQQTTESSKTTDRQQTQAWAQAVEQIDRETGRGSEDQVVLVMSQAMSKGNPNPYPNPNPNPKGVASRVTPSSHYANDDAGLTMGNRPKLSTGLSWVDALSTDSEREAIAAR